MKRNGPPPQPTFLKLIKGTARAHRINPREAKVAAEHGPPAPPEHLSPEAREEWDLQCELLFKIGLITKIDRPALACYCQAYGRWRVAEVEFAKLAARADNAGFLMRTISGNWIQNPMLNVANRAMADTMRYAVELGLTPSARTRINADPTGGNDEDPATKYLA